MASKKRKCSALSPHPYHRLLRQANGEGMLQRSESKLLHLFLPVQSSLKTVQIAPYQGDNENVLWEELVKLGNHVEHLALEPSMTEDDKILLWSFVSSYWPHLDTTAIYLRNKYDCIVRHREEEAQKILENLKPRPFFETGLGGLAPEIREMILIHLLAIPPPYGGRDFLDKQESMTSRPPISLTAFVDLKSSCLAVLRTCHQIYLEAFPIFYASKSYYLGSPQDLATFLDFGDHLGVGPRLFRLDTITSLCLKDLVTNKPKWDPQQIDHLITVLHSRNRKELEAERTNRLDDKLIIADLDEMRSLRKICLCIRVGEEWEYLQFLFGIRGLGRGVIDFVDNFHWSIRSQNVLGDDWNLQYSAFSPFIELDERMTFVT